MEQFQLLKATIFMTMFREVLFHALLFTIFANTCITGLTIKPKCQMKTFSCPCDQSGVFGGKDLGEVSVTRCVTDGDLSKDAVCKSADVVTKCHEMIVKRENEPFIESFGLQENNMAFIGSQINLTCKMNNAEAAIFLKSGVAIKEGGRFRYTHVHPTPNTLDSNLEITNVTKDDDGNYTCWAYKNGLLTSAAYMLKTVPCPAGHFCPLFSNKALPCLPGTYREQSSSVTHECSLCPKSLLFQRGSSTGAKSVNDCFTGTAARYNKRRASLQKLFS